MEQNFLSQIIQKKKAKVEQLKTAVPLTEAEVLKATSPTRLAARSFYHALDRTDRLNIIAEIKRASPSKGLLRDPLDAIDIGLDYESFGAAAISVLTEEDFFLGSLNDLRQVSRRV
jgi:indole-3-glycerol phosphate synthase